jgi:hypothetical protein
MPWTDEHLKWLVDTGETFTTSCGKSVPIYEFRYDMSNTQVMSEWARHFRNHYCLDTELAVMKPEEMSSSDYLLTLKFPDQSSSPGPSIRAGDFSEILVADYLEFLRECFVPRTRYDRKIIGNESSKGSDVLGFKQQSKKPNKKDELIIYEVKAKLSENKKVNVLQSAINDSSKDEARLAESLNGIKQRLFDRNDFSGISVISRFQNNIDTPYKTIFGAAAVVTNTSCCFDTLAESDCTNHVAEKNLEMLVIKGQSLMTLVHALYDRAANEA